MRRRRLAQTPLQPNRQAAEQPLLLFVCTQRLSADCADFRRLRRQSSRLGCLRKWDGIIERPYRAWQLFVCFPRALPRAALGCPFRANHCYTDNNLLGVSPTQCNSRNACHPTGLLNLLLHNRRARLQIATFCSANPTSKAVVEWPNVRKKANRRRATLRFH